MTKKDYIKIAQVFKGNYPKGKNLEYLELWRSIFNGLALMLEEDNPRFNYEKFLDESIQK